jgi:tetratricopeptide (TPR) repeat protein
MQLSDTSFGRLLVATFLVAAGGALLMVGCESDTAQRGEDSRNDSQIKEKPAPPDSVDGPMLPDRGGRFKPSLVRLVEDEPDMTTLMEVDKCAECHGAIVSQWQDSVHAFGSLNNPVYRMALDSFVETSGRDKARFCNGCHEPALMVDTSIEEPFAPDNEFAHQGITCATCHGVTDARVDGNASLTITSAEIPIPDPSKPDEIAAHRQRVTTKKVSEDALCVSCHRGFLDGATGHDVHILGIDEFAPWRRSTYADNSVTRLDEKVEAQSCVDCHMPTVAKGMPGAGKSSHRFAGGHSAMAEMIGSKEQLAAVEAMLEKAATLDIAAFGIDSEQKPVDSQEFEIAGGERVWFDAVVRNTGVGHQFPSGVPDLKDTWISVVVEDADRKPLVQAGVEHAASGDDDSAHRFRVLLLDEKGKDEEAHTVAHFRTAGYDHTISPRDAATVRYVWQAPEDLSNVAFPLRVQVKLRHRRLNKGAHQAACEASKTERGQAFYKASKQFLGKAADACKEQPIIDMASAEATLRKDGFELPQKVQWRRFYERGLGLKKHLSERLYEAHDSFDRALIALGAVGDDKDKKLYRAIVLVAKAQVFGRQGSQHEAIALYDEAEALVGEHPSIYYGRGAAYARVWAFDRAVAELEAAAQMADDDRIWRKLAQGQGSLSRPKDSLMSARKALGYEPRDADLLRSQLVALRALDVPEMWGDKAEEAFADYKRDEQAHLIQAMCSDRSEVCRKERIIVHSHELEPVDGADLRAQQ